MRLLRPSPRTAPALQCDAPFGEGRRFVHNELAVHGSAGSPAGIAEVRVEIGSTKQAASISGSDGTRFESVIDTSTWGPATAVLTVTAVDRAGREAVQSGEIRVEPYAMPATGKDAVAGTGTALHCRPLGRTAPRLPVKIRGWAYSRSGIERVSVFLDGRSCHEAVYGLTRPHIQEALATPDALECGFYLLLDPFTVEPGDHVVTVVAIPKEGPPVGVSRSLVCEQTGNRRGETEPSVPAEPSPRPRSVPLDIARHLARVGGPDAPVAHETRRRWAARLAEGRDTLDAGSAELASLGRDGRLPFETDSFDLVTCLDGLGDAHDPEQTLGELRRVLRPHGLLVVCWRRSEELGSALRRSFESVRAYRQQEYGGSIIVSEDEPGSGDVEVDFDDLEAAAAGATPVTITVASDGPIPSLPGLALVAAPHELADTAAGWRERALIAEADAAAKVMQQAQAQRAEERAVVLLRAAEERRRATECALERRPMRRLRRLVSRLRRQS